MLLPKAAHIAIKNLLRSLFKNNLTAYIEQLSIIMIVKKKEYRMTPKYHS